MKKSLVALVFVTSFCLASKCPNPALQEAVIGGDTIDGSMVMSQEQSPWFSFPMPVLKPAALRLYSSTGQTVWDRMTDNDGSFRITHLPSGTYRLEVDGWGSAIIQLDPKLTKLSNGQVPNWGVDLLDNECIGWWETAD